MMHLRTTALTLILVSALCGSQAMADRGCSTHAIAGNWLFATSIGRQSLGEPFPADKDITAIGTMNIARDGSLEGTFDAAVEDFGFLPGIPYSGSVVVNPDCSGTLTFVTGAGTERTDTIAIVGRGEILAMSRDPANLWTYQVRRLSGKSERRREDD